MSILKELKVGDVLELPLFADKLEKVLNRLSSQRRKAMQEAKLKKHPIDDLTESEEWNTEQMTVLFYEVLNGISDRPSRIRSFIKAVGMEAYNATMVELIKADKDKKS